MAKPYGAPEVAGPTARHLGVGVGVGGPNRRARLARASDRGAVRDHVDADRDAQSVGVRAALTLQRYGCGGAVRLRPCAAAA